MKDGKKGKSSDQPVKQWTSVSEKAELGGHAIKSAFVCQWRERKENDETDDDDACCYGCKTRVERKGREKAAFGEQFGRSSKRRSKRIKQAAAIETVPAETPTQTKPKTSWRKKSRFKSIIWTATTSRRKEKSEGKRKRELAATWSMGKEARGETNDVRLKRAGEQVMDSNHEECDCDHQQSFATVWADPSSTSRSESKQGESTIVFLFGQFFGRGWLPVRDMFPNGRQTTLPFKINYLIMTTKEGKKKEKERWSSSLWLSLWLQKTMVIWWWSWENTTNRNPVRSDLEIDFQLEEQ